MSDELLAIADRVVAQAQPGEEIEAFVARGGETEIKVYGGEVEDFVSAMSEGVGIRVIRDGQTGFAYAGTLDETAVAEVLAEARDNLQFGSVDEHAGLAQPDGVAIAPQELWSDAMAEFATDAKIELALQLERQVLAADDRIRIDAAHYADAFGDAAVATT
ncbi:MAG: hypothetical protein CSA55_00640, partial [Ilumatobacter coccineus]